MGLFNRGDGTAKVTAKWSDVGVTKNPKVRDLWDHKDLTAATDGFKAVVPKHGVVHVRMTWGLASAGISFNCTECMPLSVTLTFSPLPSSGFTKSGS